jgi:hypothetical protein
VVERPHQTLHHADTDEEMVGQYPAMYYGTQLIKWAIRFQSSKVTDGSKLISKYMGRREITLEMLGNLSFDIRVRTEKKQGYGKMVG